MAKKTNKAAAAAAVKDVNPTLPFTEIEIAGKAYRMCFDYEALAKAETLLLMRGHAEANLLWRLPKPTFDNVRVLFAASLLAYQPDTDFEEAKRLVVPHNIYEITNAMYTAWSQSMPERDKSERPPEPEQ